MTLEHQRAEHHPGLAHHFEDMDQQREAASLGMWLFLATEVMLFGALFAGFTVYRYFYPEAFVRARSELSIPLGAINTGVLLCSSLTMALAVRAAQLGRRKSTVVFLILTMILGLGFIGIKGVDWYEEYQHNLVPLRGFTFEFEGAPPPVSPEPGLLFETSASPQALEVPGVEGIDPQIPGTAGDTVRLAGRAKLFFTFYFVMTGLHALHMIIGVAIVAAITFLSWRGRYSPEYYTPVENAGLYWHFVDIVWVFLFPVLYLM